MKALLIQFAPYIVTFVIGWLFKSPLSQHIPSKIAAYLSALDYDKVTKEIINLIADPNAREDYIVAKLIALAAKQGIALDETSAKAVIDAISKLYAKAIKDAKARF